jgi:hypothetical protein
MVRAPSGQSPRGILMIPRNSTKRKFRPGFDSLESKQLQSAGLLSHGVQALVQTAAPAASHMQRPVVTPDGTGKGIYIITH